MRFRAMMRDESALRRQWILLKSLSSHRYGLTVRAMAAEAGVGDKTIRRDLELFRSLGFPLEETVGEFGRKTWRIASTGNVPPLSLSIDEAVALHLARRLLDPLAGTPLGEASWQAIQKIRSLLPQTALDYLEKLAGFYHVADLAPADYSSRGELIDDLRTAIDDHRAVHILYQSDHATEPASRDVYPLALVDLRRSLYLVAIDPQEDRIKHYKVVRIEAVELSSVHFQRPEGFTPSDHLASSFGIYKGDDDVRIKVRFAPQAARYVLETEKHRSQRLTRQRDGSVLAEYRLSSTRELKSWILSFGSRAVVLEPEELRREIAEELRTLLGAYEASGPDRRSGEWRGAGESLNR
jgi:predicted DNA-binding transcriptional regulator YafY